MAEKSNQKIGPVKYVAQVRQEGSKVVWPSLRETVTTAIMVLVVMVMFGIFFWVVDFVASNSVVCATEIGQSADAEKKCILGFNRGS